MAEVVTHTFSSSSSLIEYLKKKIKAVKQELTIITSTVKDLFVSFPLIGQKEKEKKTVVAITPIYGRFTEGSYSDSPNACSYVLLASAIII